MRWNNFPAVIGLIMLRLELKCGFLPRKIRRGEDTFLSEGQTGFQYSWLIPSRNDRPAWRDQIFQKKLESWMLEEIPWSLKVAIFFSPQWFYFFVFIGLLLLYTVVLVSAVQWRESAIWRRISSLLDLPPIHPHLGHHRALSWASGAL